MDQLDADKQYAVHARIYGVCLVWNVALEATGRQSIECLLASRLYGKSRCISRFSGRCARSPVCSDLRVITWLLPTASRACYSTRKVIADTDAASDAVRDGMGKGHGCPVRFGIVSLTERSAN